MRLPGKTTKLAMAIAAGGLVCVAAPGCGEATFSAHVRDNNVDDIRRAMQASHPTPARSSSGHLALLVTQDKQLVAYDLAAGKVAWQEKADVRSRVAVGGGLVAHRQGANDLVVRDEASGRVTFTVALPPADRYVGAAFDDDRLYYVVQSNTGQRTSTLVGVDKTGKELWRMPATGSLGAPAARGGVVAVPYAHQDLTLVDGTTGKEVARVRATDEEITFVRASAEGFFYGGAKGIYLLDEKSANGSRAGSSYVEANLGSDQVRTFYWWDGYELAQADYTAFDRNRLLWRGEPKAGSVAFHDDGVVLHSYRYFFSFDARAGKLRWAYAHPRVDVIAADDVGPSVVFASVDGDLGVIDVKTGQVRGTQKTGLRLHGVTFDADGYAGSVGTAQAEPNDVLATLNSIIWDRDARFTAVKIFAIDALTSVPGKDATAALLKVVLAGKEMPPSVLKKAGEALVARRDAEAAPLYIEALKTRYDFVEGKEPRGLEVLARTTAAVVGQGGPGATPHADDSLAREAAPLLAAHLLDPATPQPALKELAAALAAMTSSSPAATSALREFLLTYRCDPMFLAEPASLDIAGEALARAGDEGRRTVAFVVGEKRTLQPLAAYLKKALDPGPVPGKK